MPGTKLKKVTDGRRNKRPHHKLPKQLRKHVFKKGDPRTKAMAIKGGASQDGLTRRIQRLTKIEIAEIGTLLLEKKINELKDIALAAKDGIGDERSALQSILAMVILRSFQTGDMGRFDALLNRIIGKAPDSVEISGKDGGPIRTETKRSPDELRTEIARLKKMKAQTAGEADDNGDNTTTAELEADRHDGDDVDNDRDPDEEDFGF